MQEIFMLMVNFTRGIVAETTDDDAAAEFCRQTVNRLFEIKKTNEVLVECYSVETGEQVYGLKMVRA